MTDEQKQKLKDYRKEYYKRFYIQKKLAIKVIINMMGYYLIKHVRSSTLITFY